MLTLSTQTVLRHAEFDGTGKPTVWSEYNPLEPAAGWELEIVLERLAEVLAQITDQVERLEARVVERAKTLNSLVNSSPLTNRSFGAPEPDSATAIDDGMLDSASADETLSDLALLDLVMGAPPANYDDLLASLTQGDYLEPELPPMLLLEAPVAEPFVALPPMIAVETAVERERREHRLFRHLRGR